MTKLSGLGDRLLIDGFDVSGAVGSINKISGSQKTLEVTDITQSAFNRLGGQRDAGIDFSAWLEDTAVTGGHAALSSLPTGQRIVTYLRGTAIGGFSACMVSRQINYDPNRANDGGLTIGVSTQADSFGLEWGEQLTAGLRTDTTATNGTALDFGAVSTLFGGQAYLQVNAFTGTSVTVKLQDSADNSTFADLSGAAFIAATARGAQRLAISNAATVRRYVRVATTGTFSNAVFAVTFVRNLTAGIVF
jgi:hypothetical protein